MPITPKIKKKIIETITIFKIPGIAIPKDLIDILSPSFLDITLKGLRTFSSLNILINLILFDVILNDMIY